MPSTVAERVQHEIEHGRMLAANGAEDIWGWNTPAGQRRARRRAELICTGADIRPGQRVLEIGCGNGNFTERFVETGANITAVDLSPDLLEQARARRLPAGRVRFVEARFEDLNANEPFDAILGSSILHHLVLGEALANIYRLLKPGGRMCFAEPNMRNPQVYMMFNYEWAKKRYGVSPDERAFYRRPLLRQVKEAGFQNVAIHPFDFLHPFTPSLLVPAVAGLGRVVECIPFLNQVAGSLWIRGQKPA